MSKRWKFSLTARSPDGCGTWAVGIHEWLVEELQRKGPVAKFYRMKLLKEVLESPDCIRKGWGREEFEDAFIYIGRPSLDVKSDTIELPPPPDMLFLVFVASDGTIDDWQWRRIEEIQATGETDGLGEILWQSTDQ